MNLSPGNIRKQEFKNSLRGFDKEEVQSFLEKIADDIDELQKANESLQKELENANYHLSEFRKIEKDIQDTLTKANESSSRTIESAKKQANLMIQEAELKAQQLLEKARESANEVRSAVLQLREEKNLIVAKLKTVINSQAHLLEMKVENSDKEIEPVKTIEKNRSIDIDADDIADKL